MKNLIFNSLNTTNRHNLYVLSCNSKNINSILLELANEKINSINIGIQIAKNIENIKSKHLDIRVQDLINELVESQSTELFSSKPRIVAIYNLGILFEPTIQLNVEKILNDLSKSYGIILLWDSKIDDGPILNWGSQKENYKIDLTDIKPLIIDKTL